MKVRLLFFAGLRERMKVADRFEEILPQESVSKVAQRLFGTDQSLLFAANHQYVSRDYIIQEGDEIAFIPPVAGG